MRSTIRGALAAIPSLDGLYRFNRTTRDRWVREQAAGVPAGSLVLDVGAGTAPYRASFAHCRYKTHDFGQLRRDQLQDGAEYTPIDYVSDVTRLPLDTGSVDVVLCTEVLEHVPEPIRAVREFARVLRPGGRLLITCPLGSGIHQEPFHFYGGYTPYWYDRFLGQSGFVQIAVEANGALFRNLSQEMLRALAVLAGELRRPRRRLLLPVTALAAAALAGPALALPLAAPALDALDPEPRHTVGYFVRATRGEAA